MGSCSNVLSNIYFVNTCLLSYYIVKDIDRVEEKYYLLLEQDTVLGDVHYKATCTRLTVLAIGRGERPVPRQR